MLTSIVVALGAALVPVQDTPALLPASPAGWRFERLELPLSFAPDLGYEGFEELSFAPGMFDPASETYFSYALALRLEGDVVLDESALRDFLLGYYRGLCAAVAEDRPAELGPAQFSAEVRRVGSDYHATLHMFDAFVTGQPLTLELELGVAPVPRATLLFGLASPMPKDGPAWKALRALRTAWQAERAMPVFLNHLYVVPDGETYAALRASEFLREVFAVGEERTTVRRDLTYTGTYFYGERTYFEFLQPGLAVQFPAGACGIAFGIEQVGGTVGSAGGLKERGIDTFVGPITRELEGVEVPWFRMMGIAMPVSRLSLVSLEYEPRFLEEWHKAASPAAGGILRRDVLTRYRAVLGGPERPLFQDVSEVHLELGEEERARFLAVCASFGYELDEGEPTVVHAPEARFVLSAVPGLARITRIRLRLREPLEREALVLGKARLEFQGESAVLSF